MQKETINITLPVPRERVADLLCSALEGGSNYWYMITEKINPNLWSFDKRPTYDTPQEAEKNINDHFLHYYPFNEGGALLINDENADEPELKEPVRLDMARIYHGLQRWAADSQKEDGDESRSSHPHHWSDFMTGNEDEETAEVFLQYCVFGEVIYG